MHERLDTFAAHLRRCVDVRHQANDRHITIDRRWNRRHHVSVLVHRRVCDADCAKFRDEQLEQAQLARSARTRSGALVGARINLDVTQEAIENGHGASL